MNELYPIVRRVRRPLIAVDEARAAAPAPAAPAPVQQGKEVPVVVKAVTEAKPKEGRRDCAGA